MIKLVLGLMILQIVFILSPACALQLFMFKHVHNMSERAYYEEKVVDNANVKRFFIYYGILDEHAVKKLSEYDTVIIEPRNATRRSVIALKKTGTKVYGYLSVVEQNENNLEFTSLRKDWFYKTGNTPIKNEKWGSWYMDLRQEGYRRFLLEQLVLHVVDKELDGVFIDTVGDIDDLDWDEDHKHEMAEGYKKFLEKIKVNYKNLYIIQNWGFTVAKKYSHPFLDGIMWEGFAFHLLNDDEWSRNRFEEINEMNLDFYIVSPNEEEIQSIEFNKDIYRYIRDEDTYDDF